MTDNPLKKYSARPGTFVTLPSKGKYYQTPPTLTADGELEIRPMTAGDEIRLKNPDGLMNSQSLFQVIEHVAPGIQSAASIPTPDLDVIVIGMRMATYGEMMDVGSKCRHCGHDDDYQVNLTHILAAAQEIDAPDRIEVEDLIVNLRPHTAETNTMLSNYQVELTRAVRQFELAAVSEKPDYNRQLAEIMQRGSVLLFEMAAKHIVSVEIPDEQTIESQEFIREWLTDLPAPEYQKIRDAVNKLSKERINRTMKFTCVKCEQPNEVEVAFDPANFFGTSSL